MAAETDPHRPSESKLPVASAARTVWGLPLAVASAVVFAISSLFPLIAGLSKNTSDFPKWWGVADVGVAFVLACLALVVNGIAQGCVDRQAEEASYRAYRFLTHGILVLGVVFMLFGDHIVVTNCFTGFAWRAWLLLYSLPAWFTCLKGMAQG